MRLSDQSLGSSIDEPNIVIGRRSNVGLLREDIAPGDIIVPGRRGQPGAIIIRGGGLRNRIGPGGRNDYSGFYLNHDLFMYEEKLDRMRREVRINFLTLQVIIFFLVVIGSSFLRGVPEMQVTPRGEKLDREALLRYQVSCGRELKLWYLAYLIIYLVKYTFALVRYC